MNHGESRSHNNMTAAVESEDQFIKVVVRKLKSEKDDDSQKEQTFEINVTGEHTLEELWFTLEGHSFAHRDCYVD
jgi:hypothetical protein